MARGILLFGAPGSGKGDLSESLKVIKYSYNGTGEIFRQMAKAAQQHDEEARRIFDMMAAGERVPDNITMNKLKKKLEEVPLESDFVFDAPRSAEQVRIFCEEIARDRGLDQVVTIYLDVSYETCWQRLLGRGKSSDRQDDQDVAVIKKRMQDYHSYKDETLIALKDMTTFIPVNAEMNQRQVSAIVQVQLELLNNSELFMQELGRLPVISSQNYETAAA